MMDIEIAQEILGKSPPLSPHDIGPRVEFLARTAGWLYDKPLSTDPEVVGPWREWFSKRGWRNKPFDYFCKDEDRWARPMPRRPVKE